MADRQEEALAKVFTHIKERNDAVSESFCVAKWWHQEMHLAEGINMSCYHCPPHSLEISPDLHNTLHKKRMRYYMLTGRKPEECTRCWDIEDTGEVASPRQVLSMMYMRSDPNIIETTAKIPWNSSVYPKYLEVSFSNKCNLRCTYCAPQKSSALYKEMEKYGDFDLSEENRKQYSLDAGWTLYPEDDNPYLTRFWRWIQDAIYHLDVLRVTGGEPFLEPDVLQKLSDLAKLRDEPLEIHLNSNLSFNTKKLRKGLMNFTRTQQRNMRIYASIDTWGKQAGYIRRGLEIKLFEQNIKLLLQRNIPVTIMATYSILSVTKFHKLLKKIAEWREEYPEADLQIDIPHLTNPKHLCAAMLPMEIKGVYLHWQLDQMKKLNFSEYEIRKFQTTVNWILGNDLEDTHRVDFAKFVDQLQERGADPFSECFPELLEWKNTISQKSVDTIAVG
jgi:organic radical activating enzyme